MSIYTRFIQALAILAFSILNIRLAHAETILMSTKPAGQVTASEAAKAGKNGTDVFQCKKVHLNQTTGRVQPVKGSKPTFNIKPGADSEAAGDQLVDGKQVYQCRTRVWNGKKFETVD